MPAQLKTCRFCNQSNYDYNHPNVKSAWIKYGVRHSAHLACIVKARGGEQLIGDLPTHVIEQLPFFELQDLGLVATVKSELKRRAEARRAMIAEAK